METNDKNQNRLGGDPNDKRKIDDPELNQDSTYDKKAEEDFDDTDDFHKYDDTALDDQPSVEADNNNTVDQSNGLNAEGSDFNQEGRFDGEINI